MIDKLLADFKQAFTNVPKKQYEIIEKAVDEGLYCYCKNWLDKITKVKTFLFSENGVNFEDVYVPLNLRFNKKTINIPQDITTIFRINNYITILGHAGSGKTMLMKHCFLNVLENGALVPIIVELRKIDNSSKTLTEYIADSVFKIDVKKKESVFNSLMKEGKFVFFFDGFDEISLLSVDKRVPEIEDFIDKYSNNYFMLTSRPGAGAEKMSRFRSYHVCDMDNKQVKEFVTRQAKYMDEGGGEAVAKKILSSVTEKENDPIMEYLRNPLLLSLYMLTYSFMPELPTNKSEFYFNVFDTLYYKHDSTSKSGGYLHERKCKMEKEQYRRILQKFSYVSYFEHKYEFDVAYINKLFDKTKEDYSLSFDNDDMLYDLSISIGIWMLDGLTYTFPHRSMQEYFAATIISRSEEKTKKMVYTQVLPKKYRYDGGNFWSLCQELDELCFLSFFVLKNLKDFEKSLLERHDGIEDPSKLITYNLIKTLNLELINRDSESFIISHKSNVHIAIMRYLNSELQVSFIRSFHDWCTKNEEWKKLFKIFDRTDYISLKDDAVLSYLMDSSLPKAFESVYHGLQDYIVRLDAELKEKRDKQIAILCL